MKLYKILSRFFLSIAFKQPEAMPRTLGTPVLVVLENYSLNGLFKLYILL